MGKMYALIDNNRVREVIKSEGVFENIPLNQRYPQEIVDKCVEIDNMVKEGMDYNSETGEFTEHIDPVPEVENVEEIEEVENVEEVEDNGKGTEQPTEGTETTGSKWSN